MESKDFLDELGELALGSRLKRLSDRLMTDANLTYQAFGHSVQPRWFVLLALLHKQSQVSVVEASEYLGISQPAVSQFSRDLEDKGWLQVVFDEQDGRRRLLQLTALGRAEVDSLQTMWRAVDAAAKELCEEAGEHFFQSIQRFERALKRKSLRDRALEKVQHE
jgi:DNA-binding MarR family transcriptional regulator